MLGYLSRLMAKKVILEGIDTANKGAANSWRLIVIKFAAFGGAFAIIAILIIGLLLWNDSRPKPPKPWNTLAIIAKYDSMDISNRDNIGVFHYTVENNTDYDYRLTAGPNVTLMAKLNKEQNLIPADQLSFTEPVFVPSKHRVAFYINFTHPIFREFRDSIANKSVKDRNDVFRKYLNAKLPNLDGFVLFDETTRYEIIFPKKW